MKKVFLLISLALVLGLVVGCPNDTPKPTPSKTYTVTFVGGEGTIGTMDVQSFTEGEAQQLRSNAFSKAGHYFTGWKDESGKSYADQQTIVLTKDLELTAQWQGNPSGTYSVTVIGGTGSGPFPPGATVTITATPEINTVFDSWTSSDVVFANANASQTTFIMPAKDVRVTANVTMASNQALAVAEVVGETELRIRAATEGESGTPLKNAMSNAILSDAGREKITTVTIVNPQGGRKIVAEADLLALFSGGVYPKLTTITGLEYIDTSNVTNMNRMFYDCDSITHLNLTQWDTAKVTSADGMFTRGAGSSFSFLEVTVGANLTEIVSSQIRAKFGEVNGILYGGRWVRDSYTGETIELKNGKTVAGTYRAQIQEPTKVKASFSGNTLTIRVDEASGVSLQEAIETVGDPNKAIIQTITIVQPANNAKIIPEQWMNDTFDGYSALRTINGLEHIDTSMVTRMSGLFYNCSSLTSLDLSSWNTDEVTIMSTMFYNCSALETLNVSTWTTPKLTTMYWMFRRCSNLRSVDLSRWEANLERDQEYMFFDCSELTSLNLGNIKTDNVTNMTGLFYGCNKLKSLDLSGWNTTKVTSANAMFDSGERNAYGEFLGTPIPLRKSAITSNGATFNDVVRAEIDTLAD